ncbi:MAG: tetratricopeptide repeat protein, partial [Dysgonamonadaceae bacterium]|nr:tetratricopeptide repeat protein [Dysgonamonadaceae bacterium]
MMKQLLLIGLFIASSTSLSFAQKQVRKDLREGNKEYKQQKFTDAEVDYRRALEANARSAEAAYNLGNALYKQGKGQESLEQYKAVTGNETDKSKLSMVWHNIGNVFLASSKDQQGNVNNDALKNSIEAYKTALRNNPKDDETRYNLALAQKLLQ